MLKFILIISCLGFISENVAAQTWNSNDGGYNTGYGTVYGSFGLAMATQNIYNSTQMNIQPLMMRQAMIKKWGLAAVEKAEREARNGNSGPAKSNTDTSGPVVQTPPPTRKYYGKFRPDATDPTFQKIADSLGDTPEEKALLKQITELTKVPFEKEAAAKGWKNNIAGTFPLFLVATSTFEFLSYTPPQSGWTKQAASDGNVYRRSTGIGLIYFYASYPATGSAADEFPKMWRARVESTLSEPAPKPQVQRDGDFAMAIGARQVDAQGTMTTISLVTIVGRGRAVGVLTMTGGDDALKEVTSFFDSLTITPNSKVASGSGELQAGGIEVDFDVPPGYVSQRDGSTVVLKPTTLDRNTPCIYGISPVRRSGGKLDTDAAAAILEPLPGWQVKSDHYNAMRGTAGSGWPYYWIRTDVRRLVGASYENLTAMSMTFPAGSGRVNIVWGFGSTGTCLLDDLAFLRLFHSLRPRGWTSDGGKAFSRELQGTWRDTQNVGMAQYRFLPTGRYEYGLGTSTKFGNLETRIGSVGDGKYVLRDDELTITPDARGRATSKLRVRIYDHYNKGGWVRAMSLLNENSNPPLDVQYMRVEDSR